MKTDQNSCEIAEAAENNSDHPAANANSPTKKPTKKVGQKKGDQTSGREEVVKSDEGVVDGQKSETVDVKVQPVVHDNVVDQKVVADEKVVPVENKVVDKVDKVETPVPVPVVA